MRTSILLLLLILISNDIISQDIQVKADLSSYSPSRQKKWFSVNDNVTFETTNAQLSTIELAIAELESREIKAILKRDSLTLNRIWAKDFTLDEPLPGLVNGNNSVPYYVYLSRLISNLYTVDNLVFTSGYETGQKLDAMGKIEPPFKHYFFHTWTKTDGIWKLSTKTRE